MDCHYSSWDTVHGLARESWKLTLSHVSEELARALLQARQALPGEWEWVQGFKDHSGSLRLAITREEARLIAGGTDPLDVLLPPNTLVARRLRHAELLA